MTRKRLGALTIGQSPRPDLVAPLVQLLPECEILQAGALDDISPDELPGTANAAYPLVTRMQNGAAVMVEESFIAPKLQQVRDPEGGVYPHHEQQQIAETPFPAQQVFDLSDLFPITDWFNEIHKNVTQKGSLIM